MKKLTHGLGVLAIGIISATALSGCSSTPDPTTPPATSGTGGTSVIPTGGGGAGGASGGATGTAGAGGGLQLVPPTSYTQLSGADAMPGTAAPSAWMTATCYVCHGTDGQGVPSIGPEIRHTPADYAKYVVRNGRSFNGKPTPMVAFPMTSTDPTIGAITDADLDAVIAWLEAMPKPTTGQGLYKDFCGNCHGPVNPTGGIVPVSIVGKKMADINMRVRVGEGMDKSMRNAFMPPETTTSLTDAELALIEQFVMATP